MQVNGGPSADRAEGFTPFTRNGLPPNTAHGDE